MKEVEALVTSVIYAAIPIFIAAYVLYFIRILKGPTLPDRVLAVDCLAFDLTVFLVALGILFRSPVMPAVAVVLALWTYALDVFIAKYLEMREMGG